MPIAQYGYGKEHPQFQGLGVDLSFNATRLTCFALISAFESDTREAILSADTDQPISWPTEAKASAEARMTRARVSITGATDALIQYLDFADSFQVLLANKSTLSPLLLASLKSVSSRIEGLIQVRNRVAHTRPMEIGDLSLITDIANDLVRQAPDIWVLTGETLRRLNKEPAFVLGLTVQLPTDPTNEPQHNLPIPDFDETGFLGRNSELRRIKKALLGPYPVVSILGDGGIGKTAIALKVAYDLLDTPDNPFEAVVWVSAKATTLTSGEIATISGAIQSSLGLFEAAAKELAGDISGSGVDPIEDVLEYLGQFNILLILDNLETVTDKRLRDFLLDLPLGSKVLLTSRIGLGIENPVKLEALSEEESKQFLKTLAGLRSVEPLKKLDDDSLTRLVRKLRGHPLYIKWLVAGVQTGRRPAELLNDNSLLLDFCMSNVWDKLSQLARGILQAMQIAKGQRNLGELAYLADIPADKTQEAVLELMTTNFVVMRYSAEAELDGAFETGDFAAQYLARHQPPPQSLRGKVSGRVRELERLGKDYIAESRSDPFNSFTIDVRDRADVPAARLLRSALRDIDHGNYDLALESCGDAATLAPTYGEVWRVQGLVNQYRGDLNSAEQDFRRAKEYADTSPVMAYHFAQFLADSAGDTQGALDVLSQGLRKNPDNAMLLFLLGNVNFSMEKYREAVGACSLLASLPQATVSTSENATLCLRAAVFGSEQYLWNGNIGAALELMEDTSTALERIGSADLDERSADWLIHLAHIAQRLHSDMSTDDFLARRASEFGTAFQQRVRTIDPSLLSRSTAQVAQLNQSKRFGFVRDAAGDRFFHRNDLVVRDDWQLLAANTLIAFEPSRNAKGARADYVRVLA